MGLGRNACSGMLRVGHMELGRNTCSGMLRVGHMRVR